MTIGTSAPAAHAPAWDAAVEPNQHRVIFPVHRSEAGRTDHRSVPRISQSRLTGSSSTEYESLHHHDGAWSRYHPRAADLRQGRYRSKRLLANAEQRIVGITHPISAPSQADRAPSRMSRFVLGATASSTPGGDAISGSTAGNLQRGAG